MLGTCCSTLPVSRATRSIQLGKYCCPAFPVHVLLLPLTATMTPPAEKAQNNYRPAAHLPDVAQHMHHSNGNTRHAADVRVFLLFARIPLGRRWRRTAGARYSLRSNQTRFSYCLLNSPKHSRRASAPVDASNERQPLESCILCFVFIEPRLVPQTATSVSFSPARCLHD